MKYNTPEYVGLYETGELDARVQLLYEKMKICSEHILNKINTIC